MTGIILGIGNSAALFAPKGTPFDPKDVIELVDPEQPHVSVFDLSVLRGDGIFEATTVWKGFPVSLENHLQHVYIAGEDVDEALSDAPWPFLRKPYSGEQLAEILGQVPAGAE